MNIAERANHYLEEDEEITSIPVKVEPIEIYFNDLNEETQNKILKAIKKLSNVLENDEISDGKIREQLAQNPIMIIIPEEFKRKMNVEV